jgi:hypothetical protein
MSKPVGDALKKLINEVGKRKIPRGTTVQGPAALSMKGGRFVNAKDMMSVLYPMEECESETPGSATKPAMLRIESTLSTEVVEVVEVEMATGSTIVVFDCTAYEIVPPGPLFAMFRTRTSPLGVEEGEGV